MQHFKSYRISDYSGRKSLSSRRQSKNVSEYQRYQLTAIAEVGMPREFEELIDTSKDLIFKKARRKSVDVEKPPMIVNQNTKAIKEPEKVHSKNGEPIADLKKAADEVPVSPLLGNGDPKFMSA